MVSTISLIWPWLGVDCERRMEGKTKMGPRPKAREPGVKGAQEGDGCCQLALKSSS